jgi:zinc protease
MDLMNPKAHRFVELFLTAIVLCTSVDARADGEPKRQGSRQPQIPTLQVEQYTLPNGLKVILHEDHKTPVVSVNGCYKVGSKDESRGRTGFAHLFEHMMFQGSMHYNSDYFLPLEKLGADLNGQTSEDETMYYETVPSNALELALWLESDRMGFLLPAMSQEKLDNQRDVVKNERRQTVDNVPYGQVEETLLQALYPPEHPYHHSVIGSMVDLSAARLEDVAAFFRTYYVPNNAILCIAGDFQPDAARRWIGKYFGPLPRGREISRPKPVVPVLSAAKSIAMTDAVSLPRARLVWPTVPVKHPDEAPLDVLAAILGSLSKENRLFRSLVYDRRLAAEVNASHPTQSLSGTFEVDLYARPRPEARPGDQLAELIKLADAEIDRLKQGGPSELEVLKAQIARESELIMGFQSVTHKASTLSQSAAILGDPLAYKAELDRVFAVTTADVKRVANKYLGPPRIVITIIPGSPASRAPEAPVDPTAQVAPANPPVVTVKDDFDRSTMPPLGPAPRFAPPRFEKRTLASKLELRIVERHDLPIVTLDLVVKSGETLTPKGKEGLASIAASLLDEGTSSRSALQIAGELAEIGSTLEAGGELEASTVSLTTLARHLDRGMDLFADVILNPAFAEKELTRLKLERLAELNARADDPEQTAAAVFPQLIYGAAHPYGRPEHGTAASVQSLTRDDVVAFSRKIMVPGNSTLVVVGDVHTDAVVQALEARFRSWRPGPVPDNPPLASAPSAASGRAVYLIDKRAAAQSVLTVGKIGAARKSPDFFPLLVMNTVLGGQFGSRINMNLREEKGYSYGAESHFSFLRGPGPFEAGGTVQTAVTRPALVELLKELTAIAGPRPVTETELSVAKQRIIEGFPSRFETTFGVAAQFAALAATDLPDHEFEHYQRRIEGVSKADVDRVARQYITPQTMSILVVGDRSQIEAPLLSLAFVKRIKRLDALGNPLPDNAASTRAALGESRARAAEK